MTSAKLTTPLVSILVSVLLSVSLATSAQEAFSLKGYMLGQSMAQCPPETQQQKDIGSSSVVCILGPTTFAGQPAPSHGFVITNGTISMITISLPARGRYAGSEALAALREKHGTPTTEKGHINEYEWWKNGEMLKFDGYGGAVSLVNPAELRRDRDQAEKKNKSDL